MARDPFAEARALAEARLGEKTPPPAPAADADPPEGSVDHGDEGAGESAEPEGAGKPAPKDQSGSKPGGAPSGAADGTSDEVVFDGPNGKMRLTAAKRDEFIRIGMLLGDQETAQGAVALDALTARHPKVGELLGLLVQQPDRADFLMRVLGEGTEGAGDPPPTAPKPTQGTQDPALVAMQAKIADLEARLASGATGHEGNPADKFAAAVMKEAQGYPALKGVDPTLLQHAISDLVRNGTTIGRAMADVASRQRSKEIETQTETVQRGRATRKLGGIGKSTGAGLTTLTAPPKMTGDHLAKGSISKQLRAAGII